MIKLVTRSIKNSRDQKWRYYPAISYSALSRVTNFASA